MYFFNYLILYPSSATSFHSHTLELITKTIVLSTCQFHASQWPPAPIFHASSLHLVPTIFLLHWNLHIFVQSYLFSISSLNLIINHYNHYLAYILLFFVPLSLDCSWLEKSYPTLIQYLIYSTPVTMQINVAEENHTNGFSYIYNLNFKWITFYVHSCFMSLPVILIFLG